MAISKRVSNTGATAGHGMSKIEVQNEIAKQERNLVKGHKGQTSGCGNGCTYTLSSVKYSMEDSIQLDEWLAKGNCPHCNGWKTDSIHKVRNHLVEHEFKIGVKVFECLRIPVGYRPKKIVKIEKEETDSPSA